VVDTVYLLGAGINRVFGNPDGLLPPLITDFFQQALSHPFLDSQLKGEEDHQRLRRVLGYVKRYWKLSEEDLRKVPFDLEACFTLLQQQRSVAEATDVGRHRELLVIENDLTWFLAKYLAMLENFAYTSYELLELGRLISEERAAVLTFNYDTIVEGAVEFHEGKRGYTLPTHLTSGDEVPDDHLSYSSFEWNRALAYGIRFDEVELQQTEVHLESVPQDRFYGHPDNRLYDTPFLKLHGSLNWFVHTSVPIDPASKPSEVNDKKGKSVLTAGFPWIGYGLDPPNRDGWLLEPVIVTPVMNKELSKGIIRDSWQGAREQMCSCRKLVIGGYSFPPTDFATRKLFLEAFADQELEELIVINPDTSVVQTAKNLCHFRKPVLVCRDLTEYVARYG
jgi:hypothetical protein